MKFKSGFHIQDHKDKRDASVIMKLFIVYVLLLNFLLTACHAGDRDRSLHEDTVVDSRLLSAGSDLSDHKVYKRHSHSSVGRIRNVRSVEDDFSELNHYLEDLADSHVRPKRAVNVNTRTISIPENTNGTLVNFTREVPASVGHTFILNATSVDMNMFELTSSGLLNLVSGYTLDYENQTMRSISITVQATGITNSSDVLIILSTLTLTDVNEPAVFKTRPTPYRATVSRTAGSGYNVISLLAYDPDQGANVQYGLLSVGPILTNRFRLQQQVTTDPTYGQVNIGVVQTIGTADFAPENSTVFIAITAKDINDNTAQPSATATVTIFLGVLEPQFYQDTFQGAVQENNQPGQEVYVADGGTTVLTALVKNFQPNYPITFSIIGSYPFTINSNGQISSAQKFDYEVQTSYSFTVRASQVAGSAVLTSTAQMLVSIIDVNDFAPIFESSQYLRTVPEDIGIDQSVLTVRATDGDGGSNGQIVYSLRDAAGNFYVTTEKNGTQYLGVIRVAQRLDFDRGYIYNFTVVASDNGKPVPSSNIAGVRITVTNVNDEVPQFLLTTNTFNVQENSQVNQVVIQIRAIDADRGDNVNYYFTPNLAATQIFKIDKTSGDISLTSTIPATVDTYTLSITAQDDGACCGSVKTNSNQTTITVNIVGTNANKPTFTNCASYSETSVWEEAKLGTSVLQVSATDPDRGINGKVSYQVIATETTDKVVNYFNISSSTGLISVAQIIELLPTSSRFIQMRVKATDGGSPPLEGWCFFRVEIKDINNHAPVFDKNEYTINITSSYTVGQTFTGTHATDDDSGQNAIIQYSLVGPSTVFSIVPTSGFLRVNSTLPSTKMVYNLTVMAKDQGVPPLNSTVKVTVNSLPDPSRLPIWDQDYNSVVYQVLENATDTTLIAEMSCNSNDNDSRVEFQLTSENGLNFGDRNRYFRIEQNTNKVLVYALGNFDYESMINHTIRIRCLNFARVTGISEMNPTVNLIDVNDEIPEFIGVDSSNSRYTATVLENLPPGSDVIVMRSTDADVTPLFSQTSFRFTEDYGGDNNNQFSIQGNDAHSARVTTKVSFDYEMNGYVAVLVIVLDGAVSSYPSVQPGHNNATKVLYVTIQDVNDNPPYFPNSSYTLSVNEDYYLGTPIDPAIQAKDPDITDQDNLQYYITQGNPNPPVFTVQTGSGNLMLLRSLDFEAGPRQFILTLVAHDDKFSASTTVTVNVLDVNDNYPKFSSDSYPVYDVVENDTSVSPNSPKLIVTVSATDADVDRPNYIRYSIQPTDAFNVNLLFRIDSVSGQIFLIGVLDREFLATYQFTVVAADELVNPNYGYASVQVFPQDINDNKPRFVGTMTGSVPENSPSGTTVMRIQAYDPDSGENGTVYFSILSITSTIPGNRDNYFIVDNTIGVVKTNVDESFLDRETDPTYYLIVKLNDGGKPALSETGTVTISLSDINDHSPVFDRTIYSVSMSENQVTGEVIRVTATDGDDPNDIYATLTYTLAEKDNVYFAINSVQNQGVISVYKAVDYEDPNQRFFNLTVTVTDGDPTHTAVCYVEITVLDFNDNVPVITPSLVNINVSEAQPVGYKITQFSATDADSGINGQFDFSIQQSTNPKKQFFIDPVNGSVYIRHPLDRETIASFSLLIQAIDEGDPRNTGTAQLDIVVTDVNDNYPQFKENYHPVVYENDPNFPALVQQIFAVDPDTLVYGPPFGMSLTSCPNNVCPCNVRPTCDSQFTFAFNPSDDGGNGTGSVSSAMQYDREQQKYYLIPIVMWDMRGSNSPIAQTGTNTLTVTIGDRNDNDMGPGHQDIYVFNYKDNFGDIYIGRVYAADQDDWDSVDKSCTFADPAWMNAYFQVGTSCNITMSKGVPSNTDTTPYTFSVIVKDSKWNKEVTSTVSVYITDLPEEAVMSSGAVRLTGTSAEEFVQRPLTGSNPKSKYDLFHELLAQKMDTDLTNVLIFSVMDTEDGYTDVRYAAHGSPYYQSSQTDSLIVQNMDEFEKYVGINIAMVPIDTCGDEVFDRGCYNYLDITGNPSVVNTNGTTLVGAEVFVSSMEGCRALTFPEPEICSGDYCLNGGTCNRDDFGLLTCRCLPEFDGPRCQQLKHSFDGNSFAMYPPLEQCEDSHTSIEFITTQADGILMYNGPSDKPPAEQPQDFLLLGLTGGYPYLKIDHGTGPLSLTLNGININGTRIMKSLNDGNWHRIDIVRKGKSVEMMVDFCASAASSGNLPTDLSPCKAAGATPGWNTFLNVGSLLELGGRFGIPTYPPDSSQTKFNGCVQNLRHNSKLYDLFYKVISGVTSGENGCPPENCNATCGANAYCTASFNSQTAAKCTCKAGWRGNNCDTATTVRDLGAQQSYFYWNLQPNFLSSLLNYELEMQIMFRTRQPNGVLVYISGRGNSSFILQLNNGTLWAEINLGHGTFDIELSNSAANTGQWHVANLKRRFQYLILSMDGGEGRNFVISNGDPASSYSMIPTQNVYTGAFVTSSSTGQRIDRMLINTCVQDVRINGALLPISTSENGNSDFPAANLIESPNVKEGCSRLPPPCANPNCPANQVCVPLWDTEICRCAEGFYNENNACVSNCTLTPCFGTAECSVSNGTIICICPDGWSGTYCQYHNEQSPAVADAGISNGAIAAIVVSIIVVLLLILLAFILIACLGKSGDEKTKMVVESDADFDIRENVMFYDEEGAGEEDQDAYDLNQLRKPVNESIRKPVPAPRVVERPRRDAPDDPSTIANVLRDRMKDADEDPDAPPYDTLHGYEEEGRGSDAGSLSSINTSSSGGSQDYDYLNDWGPKFAKLADLYGAGQNEDDV